MPEGTEPSSRHGQDQFDGSAVRRILQRAAEEQHHLEKVIADSYSHAELEEMAAEAGISSEALRAAIDADRRDERAAASTGSRAPERRGWLGRLEERMPENWSPAARSVLLAGAGVVALSGLLLSLWTIAPGFFWVTSLTLIAVSLLLLMGASPF